MQSSVAGVTFLNENALSVMLAPPPEQYNEMHLSKV